MSVVVYDTGMLLGLVQQDRRCRMLHKGFVTAGGHVPVIPGPALSQAWRSSPKTAFAWKRLLAESFVYPPARSSGDAEVPPRCLPCAAGLTPEDWKKLGDMIGAASLPPKKRPDPVDALAVLIAAAHGGGSVITSDSEDIQAYAATLPGGDVTAVSV